MAKGKVLLKDSVPDNEIVRKGEENNVPNFIFKDDPDFGVSGKHRDYSLVVKKTAYRTGKEEDGEDNLRVIEYISWDDYPCYNPTFEDCVLSYCKIKSLSEFKTKKKMTEIQEVIDIHKDTNESVKKTLQCVGESIDKESKEVCRLVDTKMQIEEEIKQLRLQAEEYKKVHARILEWEKQIKEKSVYIINRDKPKQHRTKKEEE